MFQLKLLQLLEVTQKPLVNAIREIKRDFKDDMNEMKSSINSLTENNHESPCQTGSEALQVGLESKRSVNRIWIFISVSAVSIIGALIGFIWKFFGIIKGFLTVTTP